MTRTRLSTAIHVCLFAQRVFEEAPILECSKEAMFGKDVHGEGDFLIKSNSLHKIYLAKEAI